MKRKTICFVGNLSSSFVKQDYDILSKDFRVIPFQPPTKKIDWLRYLFKMRKVVKNSDVVFCWFAGWHSLIPVVYANHYKKKSFIVVGGYDAAYVPEIRYGAFSNLKEKIPAKYVLEHASHILPVSKFNLQEVIHKVKPKKIDVVYSAVDTDYFKPDGKKEDNLVITVGGINWKTIKRKGIETFVKAAKYAPELRFVVIGKPLDKSFEYLHSISTKNVGFTGYVTKEELLKWYQKARVVCQLSCYEGFPLAPAEGMACGCISVVTKEWSGVSEFVEDLGFYVPYENEIATMEAVNMAMKSTNELNVRKKIVDNFTSSHRRIRLREIINA